MSRRATRAVGAGQAIGDGLVFDEGFTAGALEA